VSVAFVIDKLHRAGAQLHLRELVRGLDRTKVAPRVFCLIEGGPVAEDIRSLGVEVFTLGFQRIYEPAAGRALRALVARLKGNTDVVHTYLISANLYGALAARLAAVPALVTSRRDMGFSRNWRLRVLEEWLVNPRVDRVVAVSPAVARATLRERGLDAGRVVTIPNGVDLPRFVKDAKARAEARLRLGLRDDLTAVGVLAHLSPVKGHADLIEAVARLAGKNPRLRLLIVGDGDLRASLEVRARDLGLRDQVAFVGARADIPDVLAALDVVALPSHTEGMSNTLLEAMAAARPIVATAVGGNLDVLEDEVTALLVPPRDPPALATALLRLVEDKATAARLGRAARRKAEADFGLDRMVARHMDLYQELAHA
jgi:glycosyltransferase involved in cell wall biosynthesis